MWVCESQACLVWVVGLPGTLPASLGFEPSVACQLAMMMGMRVTVRSRSMKSREMTRHSGENSATL